MIPVLFEEQVLAVIELASFTPFSEIILQFLDQLTETIGVVLATITANVRTEELLQQSQSQSQELQEQSEALQRQQMELQATNEELQEKAEQLERQNRDIEIKNREIEMARSSLEEKAEQLALSSKYKSEFLANMSHELRTPLNSLLILSKVLAANESGNLTAKQVDASTTIHNAGSDLLALINDILDLSKVEAGKMDVHAGRTELRSVRDYVERSFAPVAGEKGLDFAIELAHDAPEQIQTDEQRLQQVLKNLLSNAFKFTDNGSVRLAIGRAPGRRPLRVGHAGALRGRGGVLGDRHGHRHPARQAAPHLRGVPAGGGLDQPPLRRHRPRAVDQPRDRPPARRRDPRVERGGAGLDVHALPADRRADAAAGGDRAGAGRAQRRSRPRPRRRAGAPRRRRCPTRSRTTAPTCRRASAWRS